MTTTDNTSSHFFDDADNAIITPITLDELVELHDDGLIQRYARSLHAQYEAFIIKNKAALSDEDKMVAPDHIDFMIRLYEDGDMNYPEVRSGEDDRHIVYINDAIALMLKLS